MSYENFLIREQTEGPVRWCSQCERDAEDCVCEELSDHFREVRPVGDSGTDVCVPAVSEPYRGAEQEPYTHQEAEARRREWSL